MIEINGITYTSGVTHAGTFHADDVFSTALLRCIDPAFKVKRVPVIRADSVSPSTLVYDIGGGEFDHHGSVRETRPNGIPYAAFGKLWRAVGMSLVYDKAAFDRFDVQYCQPIDLSDNTGEHNPLSALVSSFNLTWKDKGRPQTVLTTMTENRFNEVVNLVRPMLMSAIAHERTNAEAYEQVQALRAASPDPRIIICDIELPMNEIARDPNVLLSIAPSSRGGWSATSISDIRNGKLYNRFRFPEELRGLPIEDLRAKVPLANSTIKFCHASGFMASFEDKDDAIRTAIYYLDAMEKRDGMTA